MSRTRTPVRSARHTAARAPRPRRVSGPVAPRPAAAARAARTAPRTAAAAALATAAPAAPRRAPRLVALPPVVGAGLGRVRALPDSGLVDTLLRSRAWIWLLGLLLGGIVAMQVSLLKLNAGIGRALETSTTLERHNAALEAQIARLVGGERVRMAAEKAGMVLPEAGQVAFLGLRPGDARRAAQRMQAPSADAQALMENGGIVPGSLMAPAVTETPPETAPVATTAPATAEPVATAPVAEPPPTTPVATAPAESGTAPTGGVVVGEG